MKILVINSGSSSIKFKLVDPQDLSTVIDGSIERIGTKDSKISYCFYNIKGIQKKLEEDHIINNHREGFKLLIEHLYTLAFIKDSSNLAAIGHRVVHGGERFKQSVLITDHQTMPAKAYRYPLPESLYTEHNIRRYGFHGTSHQYVANFAAELLGKPLSLLNLITLHLGNGASAAAIQGGCSVDTSMGMTPLEGLMMGTRSGDIDPAIIFYLARVTKLDLSEIEILLNQKSGLFGLCGSNDMQEIQHQAEQGDEQARLAIEMYCYRIKKYIGAYFAILGRLDVLVFTAGVGEIGEG